MPAAKRPATLSLSDLSPGLLVQTATGYLARVEAATLDSITVEILYPRPEQPTVHTVHPGNADRWTRPTPRTLARYHRAWGLSPTLGGAA